MYEATALTIQMHTVATINSNKTHWRTASTVEERSEILIMALV